MKIDRALIIRRLRVKESLEYAEMCAKTCEEHGLPYEYIDGVEFMTGPEALESVGVWLQPGVKTTDGHLNCHASHVKAWRRIVEINKPCIILEHDALVLGDVRNIDIPDMVVTTFGHRVGLPDMYTPIGPIKELKQIEKSIGVHACGLTPETCRWLLNDLETNGVSINVDDYLIIERRSGLPLYVANPPQVVCWPRVSTREWTDENKEQKTMGATWSYSHGLTPEWIAGLKTTKKRT